MHPLYILIRREKTQRQKDSLKTKLKKLYSEPYTEETKCNEVKIYSFSCNQEYY